MRLSAVLLPACLLATLHVSAQTPPPPSDADGQPEIRRAIPEPEDDTPPAEKEPETDDKKGGKKGKKKKSAEDDNEKMPETPVNPDDEEAVEVRAVPAEDDDTPREVKAVPAHPAPMAPGPVAPAPEKKISIDVSSDPNARNVSLLVPAPRGQITDRHGQPLAQVRMSAYLGVQLPLQDGLTDQQVLSAARGPVAFVNRTVPSGWTVTDERIIEHYRKRRWVPMLAVTLLPEEVIERVKGALPSGVILRPFYVRNYPEGSLACHILGSMGKAQWTPKGDLLPDEWFFPPTEGVGGLEKRFDAELTGKPGRYTSILNAKGEKLTEEWPVRPRAGNTVVTTLDLSFQQICERQLRESGRRGAFVIMDVNTGDVLALASNPGYDANIYVHGVAEDKWSALLKHKDHPLVPRAIQSQYPPASTFKPVTALAALESGNVSEDTYFGCPTGMRFAGVWMSNHSKYDEGAMNVVTAMKRSCNPWFWQAAKAAGAAQVCTMASRFGFGEKTGICLADIGMESAGLMPSPDTYAREGKSIDSITRANIAIGQGMVSATPLQVAQMMAAVARGDAVPRPRLVSHIQDVDGKIVQSFPPSIRTMLTLKKKNVELIHEGMREVISGSGGTGMRAANDYVTMAGKTGTGEWHEQLNDNVAWFAGFIPAGKPQYAFAVIVEGNPNETLGGGRNAAPLVGDAFNEIYKAKKKAGEKLGDSDRDVYVKRSEPRERPAPKAEPVAEDVPTTAVPVKEKKGLLQRLFSR